MKRNLVFILFAFAFAASAQVGINTEDPQQTLHVAGATQNVRVEGLNKINNNKNLGIGSTTRVFANDKGDLILGSLSDKPFEILVDQENYIRDGLNTGQPKNGGNQINQTGTGVGYTMAGLPNDIDAAIFTLIKSAIVEINYSISWVIQKNQNSRLDDGDARIVQTGLYFRKVTDRRDVYDGPTVVYDIDNKPINGGPWCLDENCSLTAGLIGLNGQFYANGSGSNGAYQNFQNNGTDYVKLPAGTYVALFVGQVAVSLASGTGSIKAHLGAGPEDNLQIVAYYYE